jgi:hypothetical protein
MGTDMTDDEGTGNPYLKYFIIVFFAFLWFFFRRNDGEYYVNKGFMEVLCFSSMYVLGETILWVSRYFMGHLTLNGISGSILGHPVLVRDKNKVVWAIFNLGESLEPFHLRGKLATAIVPYKQINRAGKSYVGLTFVKKHPFKFLPPEVYSYLVHHESEFNTKKIYFGLHSERISHIDEIEDQQMLVENLYSQINMRNDLLEGRNDSLIEQQRLADEISGRKENILDKLKRSNKQDEEPR